MFFTFHDEVLIEIAFLCLILLFFRLNKPSSLNLKLCDRCSKSLSGLLVEFAVCPCLTCTQEPKNTVVIQKWSWIQHFRLNEMLS